MIADNNLTFELPISGQNFQDLLGRLTESCRRVANQEEWPAMQFGQLEAAGILNWIIPKKYGGLELSPVRILYLYERLAQSCLTTAFVLTQRDTACRFLAKSPNENLKKELFGGLAKDEIFANVGISHLTTSGRHRKKPSVCATKLEEGYQLSGIVPWSSCSRYSNYVVTGAELDDRRQLLFFLPTHLEGVTLRKPLKLMGLSASNTSRIDLNRVSVPDKFLLAGPGTDLLGSFRRPSGLSFAPTALALGLTGQILRLLREETTNRPNLKVHLKAFEEQLRSLRASMYHAVEEQSIANSISSLRAKANSLAIRSVLSLLTAVKGSGYVAEHPAERSVREAMFFLIWACPEETAELVFEEFSRGWSNN